MKFSNDRQWQDFVAAIHKSVSYPCAVTYPIIIGALRTGRAWFNDGAARASNWLGGSEGEKDGEAGAAAAGTERT